jgi:uncharacterized protein YndB with AHSA1/START domain
MSDRELVLTRIINAPREKLFRAWTEPALITQWFTPPPWKTIRAESDVRPGGSILIVMRGPDGTQVPNRGVYLEVVKNERLVSTDAYTKAWEPSAKPFMTAILTFEDQGGGKTRYTARVRHWTKADYEAHERWGSTRAGASPPTSSKPSPPGSSRSRLRVLSRPARGESWPLPTASSSKPGTRSHRGPGPFSMAGPDMVSGMLRGAGFERIAFERFDCDICIGGDLDDAIEFAMALGPAGEIIRLAGAEGEKRKPQVVAALKETLAPFARPDGVWAPSSTWFITAANPR